MAVAGFNGTRLLLLVNTGTEESPAYEAVGSQRDASIEENTESIDYSSKLSRAQRVGPGRYSSSISCDSLYVPNDAAYASLRDAMRNGTLILVAREEDDVVTETASAVVEGLSQGFPDQDAATVSISLNIDGFWEEVGS